MAEYVEVMEQKRRMCNSYILCSMGCPLTAIAFCDKNTGERTSADFPEVERRVMSWAAKHPEPKYPTWAEWLLKVGAARRVPIGEPCPVELPDGSMMEPCYEIVVKENERIPDDIAQKLGIEPQEGA